ncbi:MAG: alpha/beta hydrolase [Chlamydiales bacterium]|nr:alpha/beta hydrolase [Chlamydiales bacterium]
MKCFKLFVSAFYVSSLLNSINAFGVLEQTSVKQLELSQIVQENKMLYDESRSRYIPSTIYANSFRSENKERLPAAIISHGYGLENTGYSFIADQLVKQGYFVVSIQQDLDSDPALPRTGNLQLKRLPFWERGVQNIKFALSELQKTYTNVDFTKVVLIGHSNGGDMSMLFTSKYPDMVKKAISLDSLRFPIPEASNILSIRANDTVADEGVLPNSGAKIIYMDDTKHIEMSDEGPEGSKEKIIAYINDFLQEA